MKEMEYKLAGVRDRMLELVPYRPLQVFRARFVEQTDEDGETYTVLEKDELGAGNTAAVVVSVQTDGGRVVLTVPFTLEFLHKTAPREVAEFVAPKVLDSMGTFLEKHGVEVSNEHTRD